MHLAKWWDDISRVDVWMCACINCGDRIDRRILENRIEQCGRQRRAHHGGPDIHNITGTTRDPTIPARRYTEKGIMFLHPREPGRGV
jgi:hypothetical protein